MVKRPSKKNMLRQVWMTIDETPHGGIRERLKRAFFSKLGFVDVGGTYTVARRPPKAPAKDAAET